jgi:hypothetical protein
MTADGITAVQVLAEAEARYGDDWGPQEVADTYESMQAAAARKKRGVYYTPDPLAQFMDRFALDVVTSRQIGPRPVDVLAVVAIDPACGTGILLVHAARQLAIEYARRLAGGAEPSGDLILAVLPTVILTCVFGVDIDPVAAELTRISLSRETTGAITPDMLERHIICGNTLEGAEPPALRDRTASRAVA